MPKLAAWCHDRRRTVLALWIAVIVAVGALAGSTGGDFINNFKLPGTESQRAYDLLESRFPEQSGDSSQVVFGVNHGRVTDDRYRQRIERVLAEVRRAPDVQSVSDPFARGAPRARDGTVTFATLQFAKPADELDKERTKALVDRAVERGGDGLTVALGGDAIQWSQDQEQSAAELIGVLVAMVVLFVTLGGFVAMGLPLLSAFMALAVAWGLVAIGTAVFDVADFTMQLASMIGIGVGIDYALLLLNRFRLERAGGHDVRGSTVIAMGTAGRAVLFAGITVVIALLGMLLLGISFLYAPAIASALAVLFTMSAALTLIPAFLGFFGRRIRVPKAANGDAADREGGVGAAWSRLVTRRPWPVAIAGLAVLLVLALPATHMRLGSSDAGTHNEDQTTRVAYDLQAEGFGPGFNGPLLMAVELDERGDDAALQRLRSTLADQPGIANVSPAQLNRAGDTATLMAYPTSSPQDERTKELIERLRDDALPPVERATGTRVSIGGSTATTIDFGDVIQGKLPLFVGVVVALSLLLLMVVFRSVLVPLKAAAFNLLSITATFGALTWVFQDGHMLSALGLDATGPIESFLPVMVFAIVFGLSMDYEVFLVSRMHEEWRRTKDASYAARHGLAMTGRVITAAGIIMISVFGAFALGDDRVIKMFGLGLAGAVFVDAFIIRLFLLPAVMQIVGARMWWMPAWLERRLPRLAIEDDGTGAVDDPQARDGRHGAPDARPAPARG